MLNEEDFRTALRRPYFQGPDVVEAGQHRLKHAAQVTQLVRIRSYEGLGDLRVVRLHVVERTGRFPVRSGVTAIGSALGQDPASRTANRLRNNSRFPRAIACAAVLSCSDSPVA